MNRRERERRHKRETGKRRGLRKGGTTMERKREISAVLAALRGGDHAR